MDKYTALKMLIERYGFEVTEGQFQLADGSMSPVMILPADPEQLVFAAARVYTDRNYVRNARRTDPVGLDTSRRLHPSHKQRSS